MDDLLPQFLVEARELLAGLPGDLAALKNAADDRHHLDSAFRAFHTLKGSVAVFDMVPATRVLHAAEELLDQARKKTRVLDDEALAALLAVVDRVDGWVDAIEVSGSLPVEAAVDAERLLARLGASPSAQLLQPSQNADSAAWLAALLARDFGSVETAGLTAFRYEPDEECFFRGDDPLALVAAIPNLAAVKVLPRDAWPSAEEIEPFRCISVLEGLADATVDEVRAAFRLVPDQVKVAAVAAAPVTKASDEKTPVGPTRSLRIAAERIDALADDVGELIVTGNALAPLVAEAARLDSALAARLREVQTALERSVGHLRRSVTAMRMVPIGPAVRRLPRVVRDVAETLGRDVDFAIDGDQVECDKNIADAIYEPLLHLVRNALDHGIEAPDRRAAAGKPAQGKLRLRFSRAGSQLIAELEDDGAGIDPARIRRIAVERDLISREEADALSDGAAQALIFTAGFSTAAQVSDISGRGVGLDAVKAAVETLGGHLELESRIGHGTLIRMTMPLSAITTRMLIVEAGKQRYAVPFESVAETMIVPSDRILPLGDEHAVVIRDRTVPVVRLRELLGQESPPCKETKLMVARAGAERIAIAVDGFGERIEAMVRPASGLLAGVPGLGGTTVLGTGDIILVLDVEGLVA